MTASIEQSKRAAAKCATKVAVVLLVALLALPLTGCRDSGGGVDPAPWSGPSEEHDPPDGPNSYGGGHGDYTDEPSGGGQGDYTDEPDSDTNPCAFPGDPLCPDTPVKVPPPNLNPPF
jgi:hypothetical protein